MYRPVWLPSLLLALLLCAALPAGAFDHDHPAWDALLRRHVTWQAGGHESTVAYAGFKQERSALNAYLAALSAVGDAQFKGCSKPQHLAFLFNPYNPNTVDLVLTSPPFLALRSYLPDGHPDKAKEIGSEPTPAEFIDTNLAFSRVAGEPRTYVQDLLRRRARDVVALLQQDTFV